MIWLNQSGYAVTVSLSGGRCSDWILTAQWPWAVVAVSTKQYVHTYHQTRHKSLSPQWTLNQVLVSGWEQRAAANQWGQKGRPGSPHNCRCQENHQVGKCKQKLQRAFIRLPSGGFAGQLSPGAAHAGCTVGGSRCSRMGIYSESSMLTCFSWVFFFLWSPVQMVNYSPTRQLIKKVSNIDHNVMILLNILRVTWPPPRIKHSFDSISYFYSN